MKSLRKVWLFSLVALVWALQLVLHAVEFEPEVGNALGACSSLDQFTKWLSELSGETESSVRGKAFRILTRYVYSKDVLTAEEYLREQFYRMGLVTERQPGYPDESNNLIARLPGASRPEEVFIICAHYDSTSQNPYIWAPGADDNASGTAAVLTAAEVLTNFRFDRTIEFCLFTAEELGLLGSQFYAQECQNAGKKIVGVINLDMLIHPTDDRQPSFALDVDILTNAQSQKLASVLRWSLETYTPLDVEVHVDTIRASDHNSFWDIGANAVAVSENTPQEAMGGATTVYHTTNDVIRQRYADLPFGLSIARGVAAAAVSLAEWEPSSALPFAATATCQVDGVTYSDVGDHRASTSTSEGSLSDGAVAESRAENLVLQGNVAAWAGGSHEAICHSKSFQTFVPRSTTLPEEQEVLVQLTIEGSAEFAIERKLANLYADCRVEVLARSIETSLLFSGAVSLSSAGVQIGGDFPADAFTVDDTSTRKGATLSQWSDVIAFPGKVGQPVTLCARLSQMAYARAGGTTECRWTEPLRLSLVSATPDAWLEIAGFADTPRVSQISAEGKHLTLTWQPFCQGEYTIEHCDDLISWTPIATTPFTTWRTEDWGSGVGFFRFRSE